MSSGAAHQKTLKIVILGDSGVGKTSLMNRYATGKFTGQYKATIGADFLAKQIVIEHANTNNNNNSTANSFLRQVVTLQIWDTAGQERFQSLGVGFYRGADAAILVYDTTDTVSLEHLDHWKTEFLNQVGHMNNGMSGVPFPFVVLGNKVDKVRDRRVPQQAAEEWCQRGTMTFGQQENPLMHFETSAKTAVNVEEAFQAVARLALQYEEYKRRSQPQLFVPPPIDPIDLRQDSYDQDYYRSRGDSCC